MSAKSLRPIELFTGLALFLAAGTAPVQAQDAEDKPATTPARPVVLPMTPGSATKREETPAATAKPRVIPVPTGPAGKGAGASAARPAKGSTNDYTFCNRTSYAVSVAVGIRNGGLWLTRGWWVVPAGECKVVIKGALTQPTYYVFARSSFAHTGAIRTWGGSQTLCVGKGPFQATSDGSEQCGPGYDAQGFAKIETEGKSAWTTTLSESPGYKSQDQARIAGLQRLLTDVGRFDGPIDGVAGPKFNEAVTEVRTALGVPSQDTAGLYAKLLAEASKNQAAAGLTFCNRTQDIIWTALGVDYQGKRESKGWWRLQPGQCEKVIKDRLDDRSSYAFAVADRSEGVPETWGGTEQFCTKDSSFGIEDVADCPGHGFTSTGFLQVTTDGRAGLTFEFAPRRADGQ